MHLNLDQEMDKLAELVALRSQRKLGLKPGLQLVGHASGRNVPFDNAVGMDPIVRESHLRMIRSLARSFRAAGFHLLVNQATLGKAGLDDLSDDEVIALHRDMDRARECMRDGIDFEEAGLLRSIA